LIVFYLLLFLIAINAVVLNRFWQFEAFYYDHGIFDSSIWQVAHFHWPIIDHLEDGFIRQLGDHFTPTIYLLIPIYWLTSAYEPILVVENLFVAASAFVIFLIAKDKIPNRSMVFAIVLAYTLFIGLQNTIIANFHSELPALLTLAITLWAIEKKRWKYYWVFLVLTLGCKQNFAAIGVGLGIYLLTIKERKVGLATIIFSFAYYLFATKLAIPLLGLRPYAYGSSIYSPIEMVKNVFVPSMKLETLGVSFATFGLLPFAGLGFLPSILQDFGTRFVFSSPARWDLGLHYNATLAVLLAYGSIVGVTTLLKYGIEKSLCSMLWRLF